MRLLIVDDDAGLRQSLALLLQEAGDEVVAESDPEQALRRASAEPFEAILCDVRMPKMDGLTFLRRYRAEGGSAVRWRPSSRPWAPAWCRTWWCARASRCGICSSWRAGWRATAPPCSSPARAAPARKCWPAPFTG